MNQLTGEQQRATDRILAAFDDPEGNDWWPALDACAAILDSLPDPNTRDIVIGHLTATSGR